MVDAAPRSPAWKGGQRSVVDVQAAGRQRRVRDQRVGGAVGVAHDDDVFVFRHQITDCGQLARTAARAQRQMRDHHRQAVAGGAETRDQRAAAGQAPGQLVLAHRERGEAADQAEAVLGHAAEIAVDLDPPVFEAGLFGEVFDLVAVLAAPAAGVDFLQADDVVADQQFADAVEIVAHLLAGQHMAPAAGDVLAIALGADADLHVEAEQGQTRPVATGVTQGAGSVGRIHGFSVPSLPDLVGAVRAACR